MLQASAPLAPGSVPAAFGQAVGLFQRGQLDGAEWLCRQIVQIQPGHCDALHVLGLVALRKGHLDAGLELIQESLQLEPDQPHVLCSLGHAYRDRQQPEEALESYRRALRLAPEFAGALCSEANVLMDLHRNEEALHSLDRALQLEPEYAEAHQNRGNALLNLGRTEEALASYLRALSLNGELEIALHNCAHALRQLGRNDEALRMYERLLALQPDDADASLSHGTLLLQSQRYAEASDSFSAVLQRQPHHSQAALGRANARFALGQLEAALGDFATALQFQPERADAHCGKGFCLLGLERPEEALVSFETALALQPDLSAAGEGRSNALSMLGRLDEAILALEQPLSLAPDSVDLLYRRAVLARQAGRHDEAARGFARVVELRPDHDHALGNLIHERLRICDWSDHEKLVAQAQDSVRKGLRVCLPGVFLSISGSPAAQLSCALRFAADRHPAPAAAPLRYHHDKIRVAYVSGDFREHPVAHLLAGVLEQHDRTRFETIGLSLRPPDASALGERIRVAFDQFADVSSLSDVEVITLARELEVDIVVDLMGYSGGSRPGIFPTRCAPVQVNFLGYPGTLAAPCYDYIIADQWVIPEADRVHYTEKVVWLPNSYLPGSWPASDESRMSGQTLPLRAQNGLPAEGFVFCCFNGPYKITPRMFDVWTDLLRQLPGSVLWLSHGGEIAAHNLRRAATARGVDPERLVFATRLPSMHDHLARYRLADLFLDTLPFNAHSTASDALAAGLPLLTCLGDGFAGRVAASLLSAAGCPELITRSLAEYSETALNLAASPIKLRGLRNRLQEARSTGPLFDARVYCRHLESAYGEMWERSQRGDPPQHLSIIA